jgi:tRNA-specific 2-thiouridylase
MQQQETKTGKSVGVAMSGGVDSSVTATYLKNTGYTVQGFFMALAQPDLEQQTERVEKVAAHLGIPLTVVNLAEEFKEAVLDYFTSSYFEGKTPNPCVFCNPRIKFGRLLEEILSAGCDLMATGHYARIIKDQNGICHLLKGKDPKKDQSYFLHRLTQKQLSRILMPLGEQTKDNVYKMAAELGISGVHGAESQDVCFLKGQDLGSFMARYTDANESKGFILTLDGEVIGEHKGIHQFTVGQRKGIGIPDATPYYVIALDPAKNEVIVGKKEDLWKIDFRVMNVNWISGIQPSLPETCEVKIRYRHQPAAAEILTSEGGIHTIRFTEPQMSITPGQFAVFYNNNEVLGGGEIV